MFFLAADAAATTSAIKKFDPFDIMMLVFTIVLLIGLVRLWKARSKKNLFAIAFTAVSTLVFLFADYVMIFKVWLA